MVDQHQNGSVEEKDLFKIFANFSNSQFEQQLLKSKRKLLNARVK